jgi:hypothetical protein
MIAALRRFKPATALYNLLHFRHLRHVRGQYRALGLHKPWWAPVSSRDFGHLPSAEVRIGDPTTTRLYARLNPESQHSLRCYAEQGYAILHGYLSSRQVDAVNQEINALRDQGRIQVQYRTKYMDAIRHSSLLCDLGKDPDLLELLGVLVGGEAVLFQSINFLYGSEQATHSDAFHMSTYPLGGLLGAWIALEDIGPDQGPLHYYPGSHKLPYFMNADFGNEGTAWFKGSKSYPAYTAMLASKLKEAGLQKEVFLPAKGDLLLWHANLMHGGEPHQDRSQTRRSMVLHYFRRGGICYHEITQRPALLREV